MILYLIRHAESVGNHEGRLQGRRDYGLTDRGVAQAQALAARLVSVDIGVVYASPLTRTRATAEYVAQATHAELIDETHLQEYDFGDEISGLTWETIREKHPDIIKALSTNESDFPRYPGEEGRAAFRDRVVPTIEAIVARHSNLQSPTSGQPAPPGIAIVTHAGPIVVYILDALGRRYTRPIPIAIDNASITTVEINHPGNFAPLVVTRINDTCHLKQPHDADLPLDVKAAE